jgi:DNA-binding NtrC family response regulator
MDNEIFITNSPLLKEAYNSALILQTLKVHALIVGQNGTGKKTLAKQIDQNALLIDAKTLQDEIQNNKNFQATSTIVVENIDTISNIDILLQWLELYHIRLIGLSTKESIHPKLQELFTITIELTPLKQREEDIKPLANKFAKEAALVLGMQDTKPKRLIINTSNNAHSLRKSIYFSYLFETIGENEIMMLLENYFEENFKGENNYRDFSYIFEAPLLKSAQRKYKSQLQMAKYLGLNRITLRKKLDQHKELL